ncbi:sulfurtransferase TusA family protein [Haloimpatiens sp. FM7330]|uniref:sulfurtransferase TusA family protein n=1 Tax=Haloimpatiens sp. FM7330 TaxID=3298610 RepID=UPI00363DD0CE
MLKQIDARGMSCPQPVLIAKKATAENPSEFEMLVDNGAPKNNVPRFLKKAGYSVEVKVEEDFVKLIARR